MPEAADAEIRKAGTKVGNLSTALSRGHLRLGFAQHSLSMTRVDLPLSELSTAQKLDLMERLWADLSAREDAVPSPDWHGAVIAERVKAVEEGQARYGDWDEAKERLRRGLS